MRNDIFFIPYVGMYYANGGLFDRRVMILGESHYCDGGCCDCGNCRLYKQCGKFTQDVLRDFLDERKERQNWMRTFVKFERSLVGKMTDWALRRKIWDSVMFYNYLQVAMGGPRKAGTSAQYKQAANAFFDVIDEHEPECIIVWGKRLWNNMSNERWRRYRSGRQLHCYRILSLEQWQASEGRGCISSFWWIFLELLA